MVGSKYENYYVAAPQFDAGFTIPSRFLEVWIKTAATIEQQRQRKEQHLCTTITTSSVGEDVNKKNENEGAISKTLDNQHHCRVVTSTD